MKSFLYLMLALCGFIAGLLLFSRKDTLIEQKEDFLSRGNRIYIKPYLNRKFGEMGEWEILLKKKKIWVEPTSGAYMIVQKEILVATDVKNASHELEVFFFEESLEKRIQARIKGKEELSLKVKGYEMVDLNGNPLDSPFINGLASERNAVIAPVHKLVIIEIE